MVLVHLFKVIGTVGNSTVQAVSRASGCFVTKPINSELL